MNSTDEYPLVLIPAWNEGTRIAPIVLEFKNWLEVLVIDDGSTDDTGVVAQEAGALVLRNESNRGKGFSLQRGFAWAQEHGCPGVITLDADGQHAPSDAQSFIEERQLSQRELIIGRRDFSKMPLYRRVANQTGSWLLSRTLGEKIYDNQSGYRYHSRHLLESLDLSRTGFEMEVELVIQTVALGFPIGWVDIQTIYDIPKKSYFHPIRDSILFFSILRYARKMRRLQPPRTP
jgi:glycosyltransferase involved in cell wall biosynthesis